MPELQDSRLIRFLDRDKPKSYKPLVKVFRRDLMNRHVLFSVLLKVRSWKTIFELYW